MQPRPGFVAVLMAVLLNAYSLSCRADAKNPKITRFDINGRDSSLVVNTCDKNATLSVRAEATVDLTSGYHTYAYQLSRGGVNVPSDSGWLVTYEKKEAYSLPPLIISVPASSGKYELKVTVDQLPAVVSSTIDVKVNLGAGPTTAWSKINGVYEYQNPISVCAYAITLDGTPSNCGSGFFLGMELSGPKWNTTGQGYGEWLSGASYQKYGQIGAFNLKKWAEDHYFGFYAGQYYRVKLAVGPVWNEHVKLIYIEPHKSVIKINGKLAGKTVDVRSTEPIILDATASRCPASYFISIEPSDADGNLAISAPWYPMTAADVAKYGGVGALDVKRFAVAATKRPNDFRFLPGQFYRLELRVTSGGASADKNAPSPVNDSVTIIRVMDPCWPGPDPRAASPCRSISN